VRDDISWSRNRDRLLKQLDALRTSIEKLHLPDLRLMQPPWLAACPHPRLFW